MHLWQCSGLGCPVVLLDIDVAGVVARPRRQDAFIPEPLQVSRNVGRSRTTDEQVAAILEIEGFELGIEDRFVHIFLQYHISGTNVFCCCSQCQLYTVVDALVVADVAATQFGVWYA